MAADKKALMQWEKRREETTDKALGGTENHQNTQKIAKDLKYEGAHAIDDEGEIHRIDFLPKRIAVKYRN
ncbi:hypothetical protein SDJN02_25791, partial [Cucurbita argyrosperma subsp. argyrosperma]